MQIKVKHISDLQSKSVRDFRQLTEKLNKYIQYLKFQFTAHMLLRHYDVIFGENLNKIDNFFIMI